MRGILDIVSPAATLVEALEPLRSDPDRAAVLLDIDGTLAPIVRHAADAHVPEATRTLLIEIAKRYGVVGCVSGRRAATARQIVAIGTHRLRRQPRRRAAAPGARRARRSTPSSPPGRRACATFAARALHPRAPAPARARRGQGRDRRLPLARRARRGAPPRRPCARSPGARRSEGLVGALGAQGARGAPAGRARQGPRRRGAAARHAGHRGAVRRRRHDRPRRLPRPARAGAGRAAASRRCASRSSSDEAPPELAREADLTVDGTAGVRDLLEALL